jgi:hypothetical protein
MYPYTVPTIDGDGRKNHGGQLLFAQEIQGACKGFIRYSFL